jgi:hypothetical protein
LNKSIEAALPQYMTLKYPEDCNVLRVQQQMNIFQPFMKLLGCKEFCTLLTSSSSDTSDATIIFKCKLSEAYLPTEVYFGATKNGFGIKLSSEVSVVASNVSHYIGEFLNGLYEGQGQLYTAEINQMYSGHFKAGKFDGKGVCNVYHPQTQDKLCTSFEGDFVAGKCCGNATILYHLVGNKYVGQVQNFMPNGQGVLKQADGWIYEGNFVKSVLEGLGKLYHVEKDIRYEGVFKNKHIVSGSLRTKELKYSGPFLDRQPHGYGTMVHFETNNFYMGQFQHGLMHGQGVARYTNGDTYSGSFVGGFKQGSGVWTYACGGNYVGEWNHDINLEFDYLTQVRQKLINDFGLLPNPVGHTLQQAYIIKYTLEPYMQVAKQVWSAKHSKYNVRESNKLKSVKTSGRFKKTTGMNGVFI